MARLLLTYVLLMTCFLFTGCYDDPWLRGEVEAYVPVYDNNPALKQVSFQAPRKTVNGGKLFTAGTNVLQEELDSGLHVISYEDPALPVKIGFLRIPGFQMAAIDGDYLYANNYDDLIAIPLKALSTNMSVMRVAGAWKQHDYPPGVFGYFECPEPSKGTVIGWRKTMVSNPKCRKPASAYGDGRVDSDATSAAGMAVTAGKLYLVNQESLVSYSLANPGQPVVGQADHTLERGADSIFLFSDKLAITYHAPYAMELYDPADLSVDNIIYNLSSCFRLMVAGDKIYAIADRARHCSMFKGLLQYDFIQDTTNVPRSGELSMEEPNDFALHGHYIYLATDGGFVVADISGPVPKREFSYGVDGYSNIVINGNLLFCRSKNGVDCFDITTIATTHLISKLAD
jgi:hypothetical protein